MSWDHYTRSRTCPCGKGKIEQDVADDDWNRHQEGIPVISCAECAQKFKVVSIDLGDPIHGYWTNYYLLPKGWKFERKTIHRYVVTNGYEVAREDFPRALAIDYSKGELLKALENLKSCGSVSELTGCARSVAKDKKKWLGTARVKDLISEVYKAIEIYDSLEGNYDAIQKQESYNRDVERSYVDAVNKEGILLDF